MTAKYRQVDKNNGNDVTGRNSPTFMQLAPSQRHIKDFHATYGYPDCCAHNWHLILTTIESTNRSRPRPIEVDPAD
ncbi:hypothetical protein CGLO_13632 [Colletotrichum gloeosporioides Cg-14]|uniref:Uncharacterized protein n=1 Tax=Colletotrichum gloeosporioides (strain Cg-14) TaxID=1237896 RepID=T0LG75_COLGC|nr:hypothetical protein CGLO_13632 [Colletotrichum gloeosporioides Cg-14]